MPNSKQSPEVPMLDNVRHRMLKADIPVPASPALRTIAESAMEGVGPKKAIAGDIGKDRSQIRRQVQAGTLTLRDLEALGTDYAIEFATLILETLGPLATPKARAMARLNDIEDAVREVRDSLDFIAS